MCVWGRGDRKREWGGRERERTSGLSKSMRGFFFSTCFISCNGPCAQKEKWHWKEHIIINKPCTCNIFRHLNSPASIRAGDFYRHRILFATIWFATAKVGIFLSGGKYSLTILYRSFCHLSLNREGRYGNTDDFATSFLHVSLFSTALCPRNATP